MTVILTDSESLHLRTQSGMCRPVLVPFPSACGSDIAAFTHGLARAIDAAAGEVVSSVASIDDGLNLSTAPDGVTHGAGKSEKDAYLQLADFCNRSSFTHVSLQHGGRSRQDQHNDALMYALEGGTPVVSTPFPYAEEMFCKGALCLTNAGYSRKPDPADSENIWLFSASEAASGKRLEHDER